MARKTTTRRAASLPKDFGLAWAGFMRELRSEERRLGGTVWYRGHAKTRYNLLPSLLRYSNGLQKERELFVKFTQRSYGLRAESRSAWETLFDMQHYYVPTRLLDWSEVLGVAVYFALMGDLDSPCIWLLNPERLNRDSTGEAKLKQCGIDQFDYQELYWKKIPLVPRNPVAMEPPFRNPRIGAQRGMFTIHGDDAKPIETICPAAVAQVALPKGAIDDAKEFLKMAGINEFSMFPDLEGMAPFLKSITQLEP